MISFLACEKETIETSPNTDQTETTQVETKQSDPFPWWWVRPQPRSNNLTPYWSSSDHAPGTLIDCTYPPDGGCHETVDITPQMISITTDYHDVVSNSTTGIIATYTKDNGEDLSYYMHKEHLVNVVFGKEFVFTKKTEDHIYFIFSTSSDPKAEEITQIYSFKRQ